jgi:hypothetical protein
MKTVTNNIRNTRHINVSDFEQYFNVASTVEDFAERIYRHNYEAKGKMSRKLASYSSVVDSFFSNEAQGVY